MTDALRDQYESYPYPARNPAEEDRRLVTGSPSHLDELIHHVFAGRRPGPGRFRVLVAGGGTGDATIMLGQQLADAGIDATVTCLDLSAASLAVARSRAERRGLGNIRFVQGSLLDLEGLGRFDYIDCCGVLHHLASPAAGLMSLAGALAPGGGIGLMVYAPYGRTGVYPLQEALRTLTADQPPAERLALARRLLRALPEGNWFRANRLLSDHLESDAGLYDLLLHSCDRAFSVPELAALVEGSGLAIVTLIDPALYRPANHVQDPRLLKPLEALPPLAQAAWAEQIAGTFTKHIAYLKRPADLTAPVRPDRPELVPVLRELDGPALARRLPPGRSVLDFDYPGCGIRVALPKLAAPLLTRIDGRASLGALHQMLAAELRGLDWPQFQAEFEALFEGLNGVGKLFLRDPA